MRKTLLSFLFLTISFAMHSQGVTIAVDAVSPDVSAILDIRSDSQGLLLPRMTSLERDAIVNPAESLLIFNTDTKCFETFVYGTWQSFWCATAPCYASTGPDGISGITEICSAGNTDLTVNGGTLGTGAVWRWYTVSCGGTPEGSGLTINVSPLVNTTYYVRAEGDCDTTVCASVTVSIISTPDAPVADAASDLGDTYFTANWQVAAGATSYFLEVSTINDFSNIVYSSNVGNVLLKAVTGMDCATTYYYRVRAVNSCDESSNSSTITVVTDGCGCTPIPCPGTPTVSYFGYTYNTVLIGSQCWMVENLRTTQYRNSTTINNAETTALWSAAGTDGRYCSAGGSGDGLFYNYYAATSTNNLCPTGWRTPTQTDFSTLMASVPDAASIMSDTWVGTNSCGWTGLNGGYRAGSGTYYDPQHGFWWTSTNYNSTSAIDFRLYNNLSYQINTFGTPKVTGQYVRCIKE